MSESHPAAVIILAAGEGKLGRRRQVGGAVEDRPRTVVLTPRGALLDQRRVRDLAAAGRLLLLCGRYGGIDERVHTALAHDELSIGDYVLVGGEAAVLVIVEAVVRLLPGVLGNPASAPQDSHVEGLLAGPA